MIYADHAATTRLSEKALEAMLPWLKEEYGNPSQLYSFSRKPKMALKNARATIASCINAKPEEIFFTSGGTESDNWAIKGTVFMYGNESRFLTSAFEHHAVLNAFQFVEAQGRQVDYLMPNRDGIITVDELRNRISDDTRMVSIMLANNEIGTIQPIHALSEVVHQNGALFHTDGVQAIGHIPVDVKQLGVDMLSSSAHKFNGPKGVGFLYIREGSKILAHENGGAQEYGMRAGTENVAGIVGMAVALEESVAAIEDNTKHLHLMEKRLLDQLSGIRFIHHCSDQSRLPGLLSISFPGYEGESILHRLDLMGVSISTGSACDSKNTVTSHVLRAINLSEDDARGTIRISLGYENTEQEIDIIVDCLKKIVKR